MGEHAADLAQKHVGGLMSSLSDALTGSDDKEEKEKKKKDKAARGGGGGQVGFRA